MPASFEMAEDEELYESDEESSDEESEDEEGEDEESAIGMYSPMARSFPAPFPFGGGISPSLALQLRQRAREKKLKGVRAGYIRGKDGASAIVRLPTPVATARNVQTLSRRSAFTEATLAQQQQRLRRAEVRARNTVAGAVLIQQLRDVTNEARISFGPNAAAAPYLAGIDYALSASQTGFAVAAIPPGRRSLLFSTLPATATLFTSLAREYLRPPVGLVNVPLKPWQNTTLSVGLPTVLGVLVSYMLYSPRPRRAMAW